MEEMKVNSTVENELYQTELKDEHLGYKIINNICSVFLALQVIIVSIVVVGRFIFNSTPGWGEEAALLCMVWFSLISASLGVLDSRHLKMTILEMYAPKIVNDIIKVICFVVFFSISIFMCIEGTKLTILTAGNIMPGLKIPSAFLYGSVPVAGVSMFFSLVYKVIKREAI